MAQDYQYTIGKITYIQSELTWGQDKKLAALFNSLREKIGGDEDVNLNEAFELFRRFDVLESALRIILHPDGLRNKLMGGIINILQGRAWSYINVNLAPNSLLEKIYSDFFLLNQKLMKRLGNLGDFFARIAQTVKQETQATVRTGLTNLKTAKDPEPISAKTTSAPLSNTMPPADGSIL